MNTRNRDVIRVKKLPGVIGCVLQLNQTIDLLEKLYRESSPNQRPVMRRVLNLCYGITSSVEQLVDPPPASDSPLPKTIYIAPLPVAPRTEDQFFDAKGKVDGRKLYDLAQKVGPWECGDAQCWKCPFGQIGGAHGPEEQRRECLDYYRARQLKAVLLDELAAGIPYTRAQLEALPRKDLAALATILRINKFRMVDRSTSNLIAVILQAQSLREKAK